MAANLLREELICTALKDVFKGPAALVRKTKKVRELVERDHSKAVKNLCHDYGLERICCTAKVLLENGIFE